MMRTPFKSLGFLLLAAAVALSGAVRTAHARTTASPVTITIAFEQFGPPPYLEAQAWQRVINRLKVSDPNIHIRLLPIIADEGDYYTKIDLMLRNASTAPDLINEDSFLVGSDATAGYLVPLDKYLAAWPEYGQEWFSSMQRITTFNGHIYGVMDGTDDRVIWYNRDIFKKAGLPTSWQPHSWADILSAARQIKARVPGVTPLNCYSGIPMDEASTMQCFEMLLYGTPGSQHLYDYMTKKWIISGKGYFDALTFVQQIYNPSSLLGPGDDVALNGNAGNTVGYQLIPRGKLAIDMDGNWVGSFYYPNGPSPWPQWQKVLGVAKMPTEFGQAPHYVTLSGGWSYAISAKSRHKDEAFTVIKTFMSKDFLATYSIQTGGIAPRKDVVEVPAYRNTPLNPFFTSLLAFTQFRPGFPVYPRISNMIDVAMENVMSGMKPADALATYAAAVKGIAGPNNVETR